MIIIGYPGIGKTTLAKKSNKFIDLESSSFKVSCDIEWYLNYCLVTADLSKFGFTIFVSSHKEVRHILSNYSIPILSIFPSINLREKWIEKLYNRYEKDPSIKNMLSYERARTKYKDDIEELIKEEFNKIIIRDMDYDLSYLIAERLNGK